MIVREKEMAVPQEVLFAVITRFEDYPKFLPEVVAAHRKKTKAADVVQVAFELELIKRFEYTLEFDFLDQEIVSWKLVHSNFFKTNDGRWVLSKIDEKRTGVRYELEVDFAFLVPGWISRKLTEVSLPRMLESFEKQALSTMV